MKKIKEWMSANHWTVIIVSWILLMISFGFHYLTGDDFFPDWLGSSHTQVEIGKDGVQTKLYYNPEIDKVGNNTFPLSSGEFEVFDSNGYKDGRTDYKISFRLKFRDSDQDIFLYLVKHDEALRQLLGLVYSRYDHKFMKKMIAQVTRYEILLRENGMVENLNNIILELEPELTEPPITSIHIVTIYGRKYN